MARDTLVENMPSSLHEKKLAKLGMQRALDPQTCSLANELAQTGTITVSNPCPIRELIGRLCGLPNIKIY